MEQAFLLQCLMLFSKTDTWSIYYRSVIRLDAWPSEKQQQHLLVQHNSKKITPKDVIHVSAFKLLCCYCSVSATSSGASIYCWSFCFCFHSFTWTLGHRRPGWGWDCCGWWRHGAPGGSGIPPRPRRPPIQVLRRPVNKQTPRQHHITSHQHHDSHQNHTKNTISIIYI